MTVGRRSFSEGAKRGSSIPETPAMNREAAAYWIVRSSRTMTAPSIVVPAFEPVNLSEGGACGGD
jgi:hypothetical protein